MAVINANCVGIYYYDGASTNKIPVNVASLPTSNQGGDEIYVQADGTFLGFGDYVTAQTAFVDVTYTLAGAATSSSIELTNTNEPVCRDGVGGTIEDGDQSWTVSAEGLIQDTSDSAVDLMDIARDNHYVVIKWSVEKNGLATEYISQGRIDNITLTGGVDEIATYSATISGTDDIWKYQAV
jgi:hypothetical protein